MFKKTLLIIFPANNNLKKKLYTFQHESNTWATSVFSVKDTKPQRLPIVDVAIRDMGNARKNFKIELGPVCYT